MIFEILKFIMYSILIVIVSKYIMVTTLRSLAENLQLNSKKIGNIAGIATSIPEFLTVSIASFNGLIETSIFNILSSNIINLILYFGAIILNNNFRCLRNKALMFDILMVLLTIFIPIIFIVNNIKIRVNIIPAFIILYFLFWYLNSKTHLCYLKGKESIIEHPITVNRNLLSILKKLFILVLSSIVLFFISNRLGGVLQDLCYMFNISQTIVGFCLGFITSMPELITFFESQKHHKVQNNEILGVIEATNNLLTSNILNLFLIQSIGIFIISFF